MPAQKKISFDQVLCEGSKKSDNCFKVSYLASSNHKARLGISVPKRIVKKATDRNKIKRIVRESFAKNPIYPPTDIVVIYKDRLPEKRNVSIVRESIDKHLSSIQTELANTGTVNGKH